MFEAKNIYISIIQVLLMLFVSVSYSQTEDELKTVELELNDNFNQIFKSESDAVKDSINSLIIEKFESILTSKKSFLYPFDSIRFLGKIYSQDKKVRFYTWNMMYSDGTFKNFGIIQNKHKGEYLYHILSDKSDEIELPEYASLKANNWYGALYYNVIEKKHNGNTNYFVMGLDYNNDLTSKKIIEVIRFNSSGKPKFGSYSFKIGNKKQKRVIFEYSKEIVMMLKYDPAYEMIVFDRLMPKMSKYKGMYEHYVTDVTNDGLIYKNGKWVFVPKVDLLNPKKDWRKKSRETRNPENSQIIYKID